jgi:hypothetical protein
MAIASAPYLHPKLNLSATSELNGGGRISSITLLAIPRGVFLTPEQIANPDPLLEHAVPFQPIAPTPALELTDQTAAPVQQDVLKIEPISVEPEPEPEDDGKVVPLRKRDDAGT